MQGLSLDLGSWSELSEQAYKVRYDVFVLEQKVHLEEELDAWDALSDHAVVFNEAGLAVATGRLLPDGHIGRMAVVQSVRGRGVGGMVLQALIDLARSKGMVEVVLSAQLHALGFYRKFGFKEEGEVYLDANIEHKLMRLCIN